VRDLREILDRLRAAEPSSPLALATIVRVEGSSYRREGARLLIEGNGRMTGMLSAGCLERDLAVRALALAEAERPTAIEYDLTSDGEAIWGAGTGCAGHVTLLVEPLDSAARERWIERLSALLEERRELRLATVWRTRGDASPGAPVVGDSIDRLGSPLRRPDPGATTASPLDVPVESNTGLPVKGEVAERRERRFAGGTDATPIVPGSPGARSAATPPPDDADASSPPPSLPAFSRAGSVAASLSGASGAPDAPAAWRARATAELAQLTAGEARTAALLVDNVEMELLLETIPPPIHLLILGGEQDAPPLARLGVALGWEVTVVEGREVPDAAERFGAGVRHVVAPSRALRGAVELSGRTAVLLATHRYLDDLAYLAEIEPDAIGYLALLGPASRRARLLADLEKLRPGAAAVFDVRLSGPAGLDLGGRRPEEVALAVVAEIQARFSGRDASPLGRSPEAVATQRAPR